MSIVKTKIFLNQIILILNYLPMADLLFILIFNYVKINH